MSSNRTTPPSADIERLDTWVKYRNGLCNECRGSCCSLPAEARIDDLIRMGIVDPFERGEPLKSIAKRLSKAGAIEHFNQKQGLFTLARRASGECIHLDGNSRRCTCYEQRPDTCRNHPQIGPRPGYCPFVAKGARASE